MIPAARADFRSRHAARLARRLRLPAPPPAPSRHPAERLAACGLWALTGPRHGPPVLAPAPLADCAEGALSLFAASAGLPWTEGAGAALLTERAALLGLARNGAASPLGHCRLLPAADGWLALNLARADDWELLPALFRQAGAFAAGDWASVAAAARARSVAELEAQGALLGLALAAARPPPERPPPWLRVAARGRPAPPPSAPLRVVDLSSLWAGPLCTRLWRLAGAAVTKVEDPTRPDGARRGHPEFFRRLHAGKEILALELKTPAGRRALLDLLAGADLVVESSRPRALAQLGVVAERLVERRPGLTWVSITGHGRRGAAGQRVAFGDDAAVAGGLSWVLHRAAGRWLICGDALADPLTGIHAALAGWALRRAGGGVLVELSLAGVVAHCLAAHAPADGDWARRGRAWLEHLERAGIGPAPPRLPEEVGWAP
ncbi:MAG: CoA transferase [Porticoccaceae bacterium]|nr:MAG: CoA transferase [Porticoccaceae bacterium]